MGILISFTTGALAWCLAWIFIKILFIPKIPTKIGEFLWESAFNKIIKDLPIESLIAQYKENSFHAILPAIDANLDLFFKDRLAEKLPVVAMFIGEKTILQLKEVFIDELRQLFPALIGQLALNIHQDFLSTLSSKWAPILETILLKATQKLRWICVLIGCIWGWGIYLLIQHL